MNSPLCESSFNLFGFLLAPIASFHEVLDKILCHILFIKLKTACFKTNVCFGNKKHRCLYTSQKTQWEHLYHCQITTQPFHHNPLCKLQSERFPVVLLITCIACILRN